MRSCRCRQAATTLRKPVTVEAVVVGVEAMSAGVYREPSALRYAADRTIWA